MSIRSVMLSSHLILCRPLVLLPSVFPSIKVFSNESALRIRWPKYWSFSFSISPSSEHSGLISFRRTGWISLQSQGRSRVFSNTIVQKHQFFHLSFLNPVNLPFLHSFEMLLLPHIKFPHINEANLGLQFLFCQFFCLHLSQCHMNSIPLAI